NICHTLVQPTDVKTTCSSCQAEAHESCWRELGGCGTYGCTAAAQAEKPPPPVLVGSGWGDTKEGPGCGLPVGASLLICSCGARFPYADPMPRPEYAAWLASERSLKTSRVLLIVMFIVSLFGVTALVSGPVAGVYAWFNRKRLAGANGTYLALG